MSTNDTSNNLTPDLVSEAELYVRQVRRGSIIVDMLPWLSAVAPFINDMDKALIVEQFVRVWGGRFKALLGMDGASSLESRSELKDWADAVAAIANDPEGSATLKKSARMALNAAINNRTLVRPSLCDKCGKAARVQAHHHDYDKPFLVEWLCSMCHAGEHSPEFDKQQRR